MTKEINLSGFFPIQATAEGTKISIFLHKIIVGEISSDELKILINRELGIEQRKLDITTRNGELIVRLSAPEVGIDEQEVAFAVGNLISKLLPPSLRNRITGKKLVYITKASGLPLIGRIDFGIIDRGTNLIQIRPITGCVLDCPFCSVDSGLSSKTRVTDFFVDQSYMIEEVKRLCEFKGSNSIELHIDGQGEPTLYPHLAPLVKAFTAIGGVETISLQTNGVPLTNALVDELSSAGLSRINLSLNALDSEMASVLSGVANYSLSHILDVVEHIKESNIALLVAPLWIPGINDEEIQRIIRFVKKIRLRSRWPVLGIQNYLLHRQGKKIKGIKPCNMHHFRERLEWMEELSGVSNLVLKRGDFGIRQMRSYPKPFRVGETVEIEVTEKGRLLGEMVGVGRGRALHVLTSERNTNVRKLVRIIRSKHNIFVGKALGR